MNQDNCHYCHTQRTRGQYHVEYGKTIYSNTEYYDWIRKTKQRKFVEAVIKSPENKHPRLMIRIIFKNGPEQLIDMGIQYCPKCGRKLGSTIS